MILTCQELTIQQQIPSSPFINQITIHTYIKTHYIIQPNKPIHQLINHTNPKTNNPKFKFKFDSIIFKPDSKQLATLPISHYQELLKSKRLIIRQEMNIKPTRIGESSRERRAVSYEKNSHKQKVDGEWEKKELNSTRRLQSVPSKQQPRSSSHNTVNQQAMTTRPTRTSPSPTTNHIIGHAAINPTTTSFSTNPIPHPSKLTTLPILPSSTSTLTLDYSNNRIPSLPKNFSSLYPSLIALNLSNNEITSMLPICYVESLEQLNLRGNLIGNVPKEVRKLANLQNIDLGFNKLWYLSQVVALKGLVEVRVEEKGMGVEIELEGNTIMKTNPKAVHKLISSSNNNTHVSHQASDTRIRQIVQQTLQDQNKENFNPNLQVPSGITKNPPLKHTQSKSLNQSLLDVSSIMGTIPTAVLIDQRIVQFQPVNEKSEMGIKRKIYNDIDTRLEKCDKQEQSYLSNKKRKSIGEENTEHLILCSSVAGMQSPINPKQQNLVHLFKKVHNFEAEFIEPAKQLYEKIASIEKKLKLIQNIKGIPQSIKSHFSQVNQAVLNRIWLAKQLLQPFQTFYTSEIQTFSTKIMQKLNNLKKSDTQFTSFHQKIVQSYLNSDSVQEIKWYEAWLHQWQSFSILFANKIQPLLNQYEILWKKVIKLSQVAENVLLVNGKKPQQVQDLNQKLPHKQLYSSKKASSKRQLNNLLFSQNKYQKTSLFCSQKKESLLLTQKQSKSIRNQAFDGSPESKRQKCTQFECLECPIKDQQIIQLNEFLKQEQQKNTNLNNKISSLSEQILALTEKKQFYKNIECIQSEIIDQIGQIKPSTYQNVLLEQAKCIEELIFGNEKGFTKGGFYYKNGSNLIEPQYGHGESENKIEHRYAQLVENRMSLTGNRKIELNEFLLTEQSNTKSNKKFTHPSSQRTYFKSNGTLPISNSASTKDPKVSHHLQKCTSLSSHIKPQGFQTKFSTSSHPNNSKTLSRTADHQIQLKGNASDPRSKESCKNGVFERIMVREFAHQQQQQQKGCYNQGKNQDLNQDIVNLMILRGNNEINQILKNQQTNSNGKSSHYNINGIHQISHSNSGAHKITSQDQSSSSLTGKKRSKTQSCLQPAELKFLLPHGYNYHSIKLKENIQYKNYIQYHLRNNIKEILEKKHSFNPENPKGRSQMKILKHLDLKLNCVDNYFVSANNPQTIDRNPHERLESTPNLARKNSTGKYIKQHRYTDGK